MGSPEPSDIELRRALTEEFLALADFLEAQPDARWEESSLCEGWRVSEVVAHMTMPARYTPEQFMSELQQCEGDFTRLSNLVASRDAALPRKELVANLRDESLHNWTPPGGGTSGALNHVVIHGLDVTVPLGAQRITSDRTIVYVLDDLAKGTHTFFGFDMSGSLSATDVHWSFGSPPPTTTATAADLVLLMTGRKKAS